MNTSGNTFSARELNPELPVIYMATKDQLTPDMCQILQQPRDTLLLKPFDCNALIATVKAALAGCTALSIPPLGAHWLAKPTQRLLTAAPMREL